MKITKGLVYQAHDLALNALHSSGVFPHIFKPEVEYVVKKKLKHGHVACYVNEESTPDLFVVEIDSKYHEKSLVVLMESIAHELLHIYLDISGQDISASHDTKAWKNYEKLILKETGLTIL